MEVHTFAGSCCSSQSNFVTEGLWMDDSINFFWMYFPDRQVLIGPHLKSESWSSAVGKNMCVCASGSRSDHWKNAKLILAVLSAGSSNQFFKGCKIIYLLCRSCKTSKTVHWLTPLHTADPVILPAFRQMLTWAGSHPWWFSTTGTSHNPLWFYFF